MNISSLVEIKKCATAAVTDNDDNGSDSSSSSSSSSSSNSNSSSSSSRDNNTVFQCIIAVMLFTTPFQILKPKSTTTQEI